jgi:leucyl/phenylalanyl-tRNA--protein transferase
MFDSGNVRPDPIAILWHAVCGHMVNLTGPESDHAHWNAGSHRGVQFLDKVQFPRKQKRYIFSPQFEIRHDTAFEQTIRGCAQAPRDIKCWINEPLIQGLIELHKMGFAHSYEAWHDNKLVGGAFGIQLGSMVTCDSMFHLMSNASKAAYGQTLVHLQKRGFKVVDTNGVADHQVNYGEEWLARWQFEKLILECLKDSPSFTDARPYPKLPWEIRALIPALSPMRKILRRMPWAKAPKSTIPIESTASENAPAADAPAAALKTQNPPAPTNPTTPVC